MGSAWQTAIFLVLVGAAAPSRAETSPEAAKVAVIEARPIDLPTEGPRALRTAVEDAVKARGGVPVPFADLTSAEMACATADCYRGVAQATGAAYVLRIDASGASDVYNLHLSLWNAETGRSVESDHWSCKLCLAREVVQAAKDQVGLAWSRMAQPADQAPPPQIPPVPLVTASAPVDTHVTDHAWPSWLAWGAAGLAIAGVAGGIYLYHLDGEGTCGTPVALKERCPESYDTKTWSALAFTGAAVAVAGGGYVLYHNAQIGSAAVAFGGDRLVLSGRF